MIEQETLSLLEWHRLCQHLSTFAATKLGAIASANLTIPATKAEALSLLAQTEEAAAIEISLNPNWQFNGIHDIGEYLERASLGGTLKGEDLLKLATTLAGVRRLRRAIEAQEEAPALQELVSDIRTFPELEREIHYCIDERGEVTERASPQLAQIRLKLKSLRQRIDGALQNIIHRQGNALQEAVITQRGDRFVLPVKASHSGQVPGIVHDTSSTGSTLYVEPKSIIDLGNQLQGARGQEKREEEIILRQLTGKVASAGEDLEKLLAAATALDLATARARYGFWLEAHPPQFADFQAGETIRLRQLRHPLLVWQEKHEQGAPVVPIDVSINPEARVVAITGPNTGGKTVSLKTIGIAALMAKAGLFVPAREPVEIPWFEAVMADIGDEQSLEQSLSTFSGHISRITRIIDNLAGGNCLVLLDEVGAGTDPGEGSAIAIALLKYLAGHNLLTVATTHYGELKALKYSDSRFENASVEFDEVSLQPTYRLLWGIPGRSNALTIARRLGLKETIISQAQELVGDSSQDVNQLISALESQRREQEDKYRQASKLLREAEQFYEEVCQKALSLQARESDLRTKQEQAVQQTILAAKSEIAKVIRDLQKQGQPTAQDAHQATKSLQEIGDRYLSAQGQTQEKIGYKPQLGEKVRLVNLGQTGEVIDLDEAQEQLTVRLGLMKTIVSFSDIESLDGKKMELKAKIPSQGERKESHGQKKHGYQENNRKSQKTGLDSSQGVIALRTARNTVDVRGKRVHLAEPLLEKAIASATDSGLLWIVHGKGTGRLREGIHQFLQSHPQVTRFELAPQNEGGSGVTIAYLR